MLFNLTCPSCGRSQEASERVLGKEVRCSCGARFRVPGPKPSARVAPTPAPAPAPPRSRTTAREDIVDRLPERPQPRRSAKPSRRGLPPWAYATMGGGGVLSIVVMVVLIRSLGSAASQPANPTDPDRHIASREESRPAEPAGDPKAETSIMTPVVTPAASTASNAALSTAQIVARCEPSVALIKGKVSSGTGFLVKRGVIATNAHVIEGEFLSNLEVRFPSAPAGKQAPLGAQLLYEDRHRDLAFLAISSDLPALEVAPSYRFIKGEDVTVIGNPGLGGEVVLENAISRGIMSSKTVIDGMNYLQLSIAINPGNSGGPVFDSAGRVIGVATLKSSKAEAMGFCIPVEDIQAAMTKVGAPRLDLASRHRAELAFKLLTVAGALYAIGLDAGGRIVQIVGPGGPNETASPSNEEGGTLHETLNSLDQKLFSLIEGEVSQLQRDPALSEMAQRGYRELLANYKAMKDLYASGGAAQNPSRVQTLKATHLRLVEFLRNDLKIEVPPKLLAALQQHSTNAQPPGLVAEIMPPFFQPPFLHARPGLTQRGPNGPRLPGMIDPSQMAREQMQRMREQMRDMQNRARSLRPRGGF
jgi:S1-C subfamily serine protease